MDITIYDLKRDGAKFKSDFNKLERVKVVLKENFEIGYRKIDIVSKCNKLFLCKRFANFNDNIARMELDEIKGI
jgi:hypothetical protein